MAASSRSPAATTDSPRRTRAATLAAVTAYREAMASFAQMGTPRGTHTIAIGLTGDPVPVGRRSGAIMHRNDQRRISAHT